MESHLDQGERQSRKHNGQEIWESDRLVASKPAQAISYFRYDKTIRKMIYTTNAIEGFYRQLRKVTKTKGTFTSSIALLKLIYRAQNRISERWTLALPNWAQTAQKLAIWFPERMKLDLS